MTIQDWRIGQVQRPRGGMLLAMHALGWPPSMFAFS
jgi:hypothetical protein